MSLLNLNEYLIKVQVHYQSRYLKKKRIFLSLFWVFFSVEDGKEERIELENLLKTDDLEKLRLHGFVC